MQVASLRYDVIFKKAFGNVEIFKAFAKDFLGVDLNIDRVETEKTFSPPVGRVDSRFDLYAEDLTNRVIVDIQHRRYDDHYDRFLHYHCAALLEQVSTAKNYAPALTVFTIVVSTSGTKEDVAIAEINFDPFDFLTLQRLSKIHHRVLYLSPKHVTPQVPEPYRQWLRLIQDSLDEQAEESCYDKPELRHILELIKVDGLTPQDRARLKDEYALEQALRQEKQEEFEKGVETGIELGEQRGREQGIELGKQQGMQQGMELGEHRGKLEIARKLQAQGMSIELIEQLTGLSAKLWHGDGLR